MRGLCRYLKFSGEKGGRGNGETRFGLCALRTYEETFPILAAVCCVSRELSFEAICRARRGGRESPPLSPSLG